MPLLFFADDVGRSISVNERVAPILLKALKATGEKELREVITELAELAIDMSREIDELSAGVEEEEEEEEEEETPVIPESMRRVYPETRSEPRKRDHVPFVTAAPSKAKEGTVTHRLSLEKLESWREELKAMRELSKKARPSKWEQILECVDITTSYTAKELMIILGISPGQIDDILKHYPSLGEGKTMSGEGLVYAACEQASKKYC